MYRKGEKSPDFKRKAALDPTTDRAEALWIDSRTRPEWVTEYLREMDAELQEQEQ